MNIEIGPNPISVECAMCIPPTGIFGECAHFSTFGVTHSPKITNFVRPFRYGFPHFRHIALACIFLLLSPTPSAAFTDKYDAQIQKAVKRYWADFPHWKAWKAQLYQESRLDPNAVSPVGARGLAQLMPGTFAEASRALGIGGSPHDDTAIELGAWYMARQRRVWRGRDRTGEQRNRLGQASYNSGAGNIIAAQEVCNNALAWEQIYPCLHYITGVRNSHETITYVERIDRYWKRLELE